MDLKSEKEKVFPFSVQEIFIYPLVAHLRRPEAGFY